MTEIFDKNGKPLDIKDVITPFWLWLVREAKVEVIDAEEFIEVHGFLEPGDSMVPVMPFTELLDLYKGQMHKKLYEIVQNKVEDLLREELIAEHTNGKTRLPNIHERDKTLLDKTTELLREDRVIHKIVVGPVSYSCEDMGHSLYNPLIWPEPIRKPANAWLGRDFCEIPLDQIPFDHSVLSPTECIKNQWDEVLIFQGAYYQLFTNNPDIYLKNWFCEWKKV